MIHLKVQCPHLGDALKGMRFSLEVPIQAVVREIAEKLDFKGADHGLFQPEVEGRNKARWLKETNTLKYYNLTNDLVVIFKKKHRPLRVRLVDGTVKTVIIDDTLKVSQIRDTIGRKLGIQNAEEFGLRKMEGKEGAWLKNELGLYEQDIHDQDLLVFDKSFFFHDDFIDISDPVQLHLVFSKSVESIITATYPVTYQEAITLAAIQCQATLGDYQPGKHKPGFLKLEDFIPQQWIKQKGSKNTERAIYDEFKSLVGTTDINAKYRYVQTVRALSTYGISFYKVWEDAPKKSDKKKGKRIEFLLGISKEKILKMDAQSKEVLREEPLTHLKRWEGLKGKFTFDWGDHDDSFWIVYTDHHEEIAGKIAGYIDLIINARKATGNQIELLHDSNTAEVSDAPIVQIAQMGVVLPGGLGGSSGQELQPQTMQIKNMSDALQFADVIKQNLRTSRARSRPSIAPIPQAQWIDQLVNYERGTDEDIEELVKSVSGDPSTIDRAKLDKIAQSISDRLDKFSRLSQSVAAGGDPILVDCSTAVVDAIGQVMSAASAVAKNPFDQTAHQNLAAAKHQYDAAGILMKSAQMYDLNDEGTVQLVQGAVRAVEAAVRDLMNDGQQAVDAVRGDQNKERLLNNFVKQIPPARDALVASATTLAPAVMNQSAKTQISNDSTFLNGLAQGLKTVLASTGADPRFVDKIGKSARAVGSALDQLVSALDSAEGRGNFVIMEPAQESLSTALKKFYEADPKNKSGFVDVLKEVATAANTLNLSALQAAQGQPEDLKIGLEAQCGKAKTLISDMTNVGKVVVKNPADLEQRSQLIEIGQTIEDVVAALVADVNNCTAGTVLRYSAKTAAGHMLELASVVPVAFNNNPEMLGKVNTLHDSARQLVDSLKPASSNPLDAQAQEQLKTTARAIAPVVAKFISEIKRTRGLTAINEQTVSAVASALQADLQKLMSSIDKVEKADRSGADVSQALKDLDANQSQIEAAEFSAHSNLLFGTAGQTREGAVELLQQFADNLLPKVENLNRAAHGVGPMGPASVEVAESAADVSTAAEAVASTVPDTDSQMNILKSAKNLNANLARVVNASKAVRGDKDNARNEENLKQARNDFTKSLGDLLTSAKGVDMREADQAIRQIKAEVPNVRPTPGNQDFTTTAKALGLKTKAFNAASQQLARTVKTNPRRIGANAKLVATTAKQLVAASNLAAGAAETEQQKTIVTVTKTLLDDSADLIEYCKSAAVTQQYDGLDSAAQRVGANAAILEGATSGSSFPEVDDAINSIARALDGLDDLSEDVVAKSRRGVVKDVETACVSLAGAIPRVSSAAAVGTDMIGIYAKEAANSVVAIIATAKASKGRATGAQSSVLDPVAAEFVKKCAEIMSAPGNTAVTGPATVKINQLLKEMTSNARDTAMSLAADKERQAQYINSTKVLTQSVPKLAGYIKANQPDLVSKCADILSKTVIKLESARSGIEESQVMGGSDDGVPVEIQQKLTTISRAIGNSATNFLKASAQLAGDPLNQVLANTITASSQAFMGSITSLVTVSRDLDAGKQEVFSTASELQKAIGDLDTATINAGVGLLEKPNKSSQQVQKEFAELLNAFAPDIRTLQEKSGASGDSLMQIAKRIKSKIPDLVEASQNVAASESNANNSKKLLLQTKNFCNGLLSLVNECYTGGDRADEFGKDTSDAIGELLGQLTASDQILQELDQLVASVRRMGELLNQPSSAIARPYHEIKENVVEAARKVTASGSALKSCQADRVGTIGLQAKNLARSVPGLITHVRDAVAVVPDAGTREKIVSAMHHLIECCGDLITTSRTLAAEDNLVNRGSFNNEFEQFSDSIRELLNSVKKGALGETKIDDGVDSLTQVINKLNASAIFTSAGQSLEGVKKVNAPFDSQVASLVTTATKIKGAVNFSDVATMSQEQLGQKVDPFVHIINVLAEASLSCADVAPSNETQQSIINATKAVTIAAKQIVLSAKDYQKTPTDATAKATLDSGIASFPRAVDTYMSILKGDQAMFGVNRLELLKKEFQQSMDNVEATTSATAVTVLESARAVAKSSAPLVFASSGDELIDAANSALRSVEDLLSNVKGAAASEPKVGPELSDKAKTVAAAVSELLEAAKANKGDNAGADRVSKASLAVNKQLETLIVSLNKMPGGSQLRLNADTDLEAATDRELSAAAALIKSAMASLPKGLGSSLSSSSNTISAKDIISEEKLTEAVTVSARVIAEATCKLLVCAHEAQTERGKTSSGKRYYEDPTWSNGLISASQKVAAGVSRLISDASKASSGKLEEEELTVDAKHVASCVKQFVIAARVKEGISDNLQSEISEAAKEVARSTADMLSVAQKAGDFKEQTEVTRGRKKTVLGVAGSIAQRLEQQTKILRLEKQLEDARKSLTRANASEYKK